MTEPDETPNFVSPYEGVQGEGGRDAWVRPGELLVEVGAEADLAARLRVDGERGAPYRPDPGDPGDWRQFRGAPDYGDINARLRRSEVPVRLWTGLRPQYAVDLVRNARVAGVHLHHVLVGEDFYHGGPGSAPCAVSGPQKLSAYRGDGEADIAVLDTGLPSDWGAKYGDLSRTVTGVGAQNLPEDPLDEDRDGRLDAQAGHGVFICGLIARVTPHANVDVHRVLHATGEGDEALIMATLAPLVTSTVTVINLSLGCFTVDDMPPVLADTVRTLAGAGKVVVAAAGNAGMSAILAERPFWPAAMPEVVSVGAYDSTAGVPTQWPHSCGGDVYAPGVDLRSNYVWWPAADSKFDGWAQWSGTSFATPLVAARIADLVAGAPPGDTTGIVAQWLSGLPVASWRPKRTGAGPSRLYQPPDDTTKWPA
jgi:hypothetical protein